MSAVLMTISNLSTRSEISQNLRNLNIPKDKYCEFLEMKGIFEFNLSPSLSLPSLLSLFRPEPLLFRFHFFAQLGKHMICLRSFRDSYEWTDLGQELTFWFMPSLSCMTISSKLRNTFDVIRKLLFLTSVYPKLCERLQRHIQTDVNT